MSKVYFGDALIMLAESLIGYVHDETVAYGILLAFAELWQTQMGFAVDADRWLAKLAKDIVIRWQERETANVES
jgi:hypothetical protein